MHSLDYRQHYGNPFLPAHPGHQQNPKLTPGQMLMIGAAALAVGGLGYWGYQAMKGRNGKTATATNGGAENPGIWRNAA